MTKKRSDTLTFEDILVGERFIVFPTAGDDAGHGGYKGVHWLFVKTDESKAAREVDKSESNFPAGMEIIKVA